MSDFWDDELARSHLRRVADHALAQGECFIAAHLYHDANEARGIRSRRAFSRSLRAVKLGAERVQRALHLLDVAQRLRGESLDRAARQLRVPDTRSPIERAIDDACGVTTPTRTRP